MKQDEAISLAGHVLSRGNPFNDALSANARLRELLPAEHRDVLYSQLSEGLSPYIEAAMSLAGHVLGDGADKSEADAETLPADVIELVIAAREIAFGDLFGGTLLDEEGRAAFKRLDKASEAFAARVPWDDEPIVLTGEQSPLTLGGATLTSEAEYMLSLLKGQHPMGTTFGKLSKAIGYDILRLNEGEAPPWAMLRNLELVREDEGGIVFATEAVVANTDIPSLPWPDQ